MSSAAVGTHHHHQSGVGPLSLMSCVRESSPLQDHEPPDVEKNAATKKKFWNPKKWFRRKNKAVEDVVPVEIVDRDDVKSRSTSELSITDEQIRRRSGSSMHPGLSVSHDSVFHSPNSGSDIELGAAQSSSSLSISQPQIDARLQTELSERLKLRRGRGDISEDDEGLPHSPCNSPTTTDVVLDRTAVKDLPTKSHSTCSDGSLLSMDTSEIEEESFFSQQSSHPSKLLLQEKQSSDQDFDLELESFSANVPLNHSAAHHRVSVRPNKRRAPHRNKRQPQLSNALPITPEVNEDLSIRSETETCSREFSEHYSTNMTTTIAGTQFKCSSLPPGLAPPGGGITKLNRSCSNAGVNSRGEFITLEEESLEKEEKSDKSFFDRIFPRRSAKKRKSKEEKTLQTPFVQLSYTKDSSYSGRNESKPIAAPRTGAAARQRIQPIDLPPSPEIEKKSLDFLPKKQSPDKSVFGGTSPLHLELENRMKQRQTLNASLSTPPQSSEIIRNIDAAVIKEESKNKMKITSSILLKQKVSTLSDEANDEDDGGSCGFKSLNDLPAESLKSIKSLVTKSHSFKSTNSAGSEHLDVFLVAEATNERKISATLDNSKHDSIGKEDDGEKNEQQNNERDELRKEDLLPASFSDLASEIFGDLNDVIISGPSHTAVVAVSSNTPDSYDVTNAKTEMLISDEKVNEFTMKESISVTKIQLKRESTEVTQTAVTVHKNTVPEFLNKHLNKVEVKSSSNVVFSMNSSPKIIDEQSRPKSVFTNNTDTSRINSRKFSTEEIEILEKNETQTQPRFKKNDNNKRKSSASSATSESPKIDKSFVSSRSISLDSLKVEGENFDKSSQDSLDKLEEKEETFDTCVNEKNTSTIESVVLRKKQYVKQKNDEEPELMKVFARRSLKLKDTDSEIIGQHVSSIIDSDTKTRDSDKENQADSPQEERRKPITKDFAKTLSESKIIKKEGSLENETSVKLERKLTELAEVTLRKPNNNFNNNNIYPRSFSLNTPRVGEVDESNVKKQLSFNEKSRITDSWISNIKNTDSDDLIERKILQDEIITGISPKSDYLSEELLTEKKKFIQRKAEWEKRAQEAQKKSVP